MQTPSTLPVTLARPATPRPSTLWSLLSALLVGTLVATDRVVEALGR